MFIDARSLPSDERVETDVCIVGGGAAGITLARELAGRQFRVALLEAGGLDEKSATPSLFAGKSVGVPYFPLERARLRYLGGSTNHWGGWSRPLDEIDFESRPWIPHSGWPIRRSDLDVYYERANAACGLGPSRYDFRPWEEPLARAGRRPPRFDPDALVDRIFHVIPDHLLRFGEAFRSELQAATNLDLYLHTAAVELETDGDGNSVRTARFSGLDGKKLTVAAKLFVIASGGLEVPRLLLLSRRARPNGLGNDHDLVGRFFLEHPHMRSGIALFSRPYRPFTSRAFQVGSSLVVECLGASEELQRREQLPNFGLRLLPVVGGWLSAARRIIRRGGSRESEEDASGIGTILSDWRQVGVAVSRKLFRAPSGDVLYRIPYRTFSVHYTWEQIPNPDSRVHLGDERDELGLPRLVLDWRLNDQDRDTLMQAQRIVESEMARRGLGSVRGSCAPEEWETVLRESEEKIDSLLVRKNNEHLATLVPSSQARNKILIGSYHHLGTTRMSDDPKRGVVDRNCRVHGVENLFVAGGSVFPTVGISNPTLTIVALAIRLADFLRDRMERRAAVS
jgi:choline dehydrogenase-like flavoprotein